MVILELLEVLPCFGEYYHTSIVGIGKPMPVACVVTQKLLYLCNILHFLHFVLCSVFPHNAGDASQLSMENEGPSSSHNDSIQNISTTAGLPIYSAMEVPSPKTPSSTTPPHPIPKLTSFKEATRGLESSSGVTKRVTSLGQEEKKKRQEQMFEEHDNVDPTPLTGALSMPNLTPFRKTTQTYNFSATLSKCKDKSEEDRKKFVEELIEEYDIIDLTPFSDTSYTPKLTLFKEEVTQSLEGSLVVVSKCMRNPEEMAKRIIEEYDIIDPKEITL